MTQGVEVSVPRWPPCKPPPRFATPGGGSKFGSEISTAHYAAVLDSPPEGGVSTGGELLAGVNGTEHVAGALPLREDLALIGEAEAVDPSITFTRCMISSPMRSSSALALTYPRRASSPTIMFMPGAAEGWSRHHGTRIP